MQNTSAYWQKIMRAFIKSDQDKMELHFDSREDVILHRPQIYSARETLNSVTYRFAKGMRQRRVVLISRASSRGNTVCFEKTEVEPNWNDRRSSFTWKDALKTKRLRPVVN